MVKIKLSDWKNHILTQTDPTEHPPNIIYGTDINSELGRRDWESQRDNYWETVKVSGMQRKSESSVSESKEKMFLRSELE